MGRMAGQLGFGFLLVAVTLPLSAIAKNTTLYYSEKVLAEHQQLLNADLVHFRDLVPVDADGELKRILKLDNVSAVDMDQWLSERVHFVVEETYNPNQSLVIERKNAKYPLAAVPVVNLAANEATPQQSPKGRVVMSNIGAGIYQLAKNRQLLLSAVIPGVGSVSVRSPRAGILQIGEGLFQKLVDSWPQEKIKNEMHSIWRVMTLFHEARHSDGNGKSLSFSHVMCPPEHNYFGKYACDSTANGAYRVSSLVIKSLSAACKTCTIQEKGIFGIMTADHLNRILVPVKRTPGVNDLCRLAEANGKNPAFCQRQEVGSDFELDDAPESVEL